MTRDEAREMLVQSIENEATHDAAVKLRERQSAPEGRDDADRP